MEIAAAESLRDRLMVAAQQAIRSPSIKLRLSTWANIESGSAEDTPSLTISIGVLLGESPGEAGISVRSTVPLEELGGLFLPALRRLTDRVDVQVIAPVRPEQGVPRGPMDEPPRIGSALSHPLGGPGTLGAFVRERSSGRIGVLSNNHVLANTNQANPGAETWYNNGKQSRPFGLLARYPKLAEPDTINQVDAAYSLITERPVDPGNVAGKVRLSGNIIAPTERMRVCKYGYMTGYTEGQIKGIGHNNLYVWYRGLTCRFDNQIEIESAADAPFSLEGDSGSLVVTPSGDAVGLVIGGTKTQDGTRKLTYANPLRPVLDLLDLSLIHQ